MTYYTFCDLICRPTGRVAARRDQPGGFSRAFGPLIALVTALAACCSLLAVRAYVDTASPQAVLGRYFAAVAEGDATGALAWSNTGQAGPYLTAAVLSQQLQLARLTDLQIGRAGPGSATQAISVSYVLQFADAPVTVRDVVSMVKSPVGWRLASAAAPGRLALGVGGDRVMLAGRRPPAAVALFPGAVPLTTDSPGVAVNGHPVVSLAGSAQSIPVTASLTPGARATISQAVNAALRRCLASDPVDARVADADTGARPAGSAAGSSVQLADPLCPVPDAGRVVPASLRASSVATAKVTSTLGRAGIVTATARISVTGRYRVWDFTNQVLDRTGRVSLSLRARLSVRNLGAVVWQVR